MIKLIASDIDGTLIPEGKEGIPEELFTLIRTLKEKDTIFVAASGRQYASMRRLFEPVADDIIFICENGGYITCRGQDILQVPMDREKSHELIRDLRTYEGCQIIVSDKDYTYVDESGMELYDLLIHQYHNQTKAVKDLLEEDINILKISLYCENGVADLAPELIARWENTFHSTKAGALWVDFMDHKTDKGNAIKHIQKTLHIAREESMAFGDNQNDLGMLASVEESYAIGNAAEEIKAKAKHVADTNVNLGVVKVLREVVKEMEDFLL